jgi:Asp-tRNA(Asn)/Glu-tRNA(Gln) amidotransferase C subunit
MLDMEIIHHFNVQEYVQQMSVLLNLEISNEYKDGVITNFEKIKDIAEIVNNFPLPESIEIAPIFEP